MTHEQYNKARVVFEEIEALKDLKVTSIIDRALSAAVMRHDRDKWAEVDKKLIEIVTQRITDRLIELQTEALKM